LRRITSKTGLAAGETLVRSSRGRRGDNTIEGKSLVALQTCTLPDYEKRLIVQGERVEKNA
jgi:sortase (surface protein transpeptidase)